MADLSTVFVTGGTGFLGSRIVAKLLAKNYEVVVLKKTDSKLNSLLELSQNNRLHFLDYKDGLEKFFKKNKIDFVIHLATCYGRTEDSFLDVVKTNLVLPLELLELSLKYSVKSFLNADTFFNPDLGLELKQRSYITTKKFFLEMAEKIVEKTDVKFVNMRIEQMYGPKDSEKKFVISVLKDLMANESTLKLTSGKQKRDFIYVDDVAEAFIKALDKYNTLNTFEEFGIGFGKSISIKKTVSLMKKLLAAKQSCDGVLYHIEKMRLWIQKQRLKQTKKLIGSRSFL